MMAMPVTRVGAAMLLVALAGCGDDGSGWAAGVDHPYLPLRSGATWVYEGTDDGEPERIEVVVTDERKRVMDVDAVVVRDRVWVDGELVEDTDDWFAQDRDGTVWYLGEDAKEYEDGEIVSTDGSWEAGLDGARPGIAMPARPRVGLEYAQERYEGEAEDRAEVIRVGGGRVVTKEWNPLEPGTVEEKHYERGVGLVLEVVTEGGDGRVELVSHEPGR